VHGTLVYYAWKDFDEDDLRFGFCFGSITEMNYFSFLFCTRITNWSLIEEENVRIGWHKSL
jgi:hypothetical protein